MVRGVLIDVWFPKLGEEIRSKIRFNLPYASVNTFFVAKKGHVQEPRKDPVGIIEPARKEPGSICFTRIN
jgi:hypothetical protein